jgi:hypothetical protein
VRPARFKVGTAAAAPRAGASIAQVVERVAPVPSAPVLDPGAGVDHAGSVPWWLVVAFSVVLVASPPLEARLWRAGRLSDRTITILMLGRMPAIALVVCVAHGASPVLTAGIVAITLLPLAIFFRIFMHILAEQDRGPLRQRH